MADFTTYAVKNGSALDKAFKVRGGFRVVAANSEAEVANARPLTEEQIDAFARDGVKVKPVDKAKKNEKPGEGPQAVHRGAGSYSVVEGSKELVEKLTKEEAEAFNKMDADAKAAFITSKTKPAE
ncbi:hypothetical protein [Brevundimonas naejangsanensis]